MPSIQRVICVGVAAILLVTGVGLGAIVASPPAGASGLSWSVVPTPNPSSTGDALHEVSCITSLDCWAVGQAFTGSNGTVQNLAEHWNGSAWSTVTTPDTSPSEGNSLAGLACVSTSDCWAVGASGPFVTGTGSSEATLAEHWNGGAWSIVNTPNTGAPTNLLDGVACVSSSDCWASGVANIGSLATQSLAEHWNGTAWSIVATPNTSSSAPQAVACASTSDCWLVGFAGSPGQTLAEHWNGTAWSVVATPNASTSANVLSGVTCTGASDCWAVGFADIGPNNLPLTLSEHWNGSAWSIVTTPNPGSPRYLTGVFCITASDCWAVGYSPTLLEHWDGTAWSIFTPSDGPVAGILTGVTCISGTECWAVGNTSTQTLAEHGTISQSPTTTKVTSTPAVEGQTDTLTATVKPTSGGGTPTGSVLFIDWTAGTLLGSVALSGGAASLNTVFPEEGSHLVSAVYTGDSNFLPSHATQTITVTDAALSGQSPSAPLQGGEGVPFFAQAVPLSGVVASFTDGDPGGTVSDYGATIDWGDGTFSAGTVGTSASGFTVSGSHTYQEDGNYPLIVHIGDVGGSTTSVGSSAHVSEPTNFLAFLVDVFFERFGF